MNDIPLGAILKRGGIYLGLWGLLAGMKPADIVVGLITCAAATLVSFSLHPSNRRHWQFRAMIKLALRFAEESINSGVLVARWALDPKLPLNPGFIAYRVRLAPGMARNGFATLTSVMPGTLPSGENENGELLYHCLDVDQPVTAQLRLDEDLLLKALGVSDDDV